MRITRPYLILVWLPLAKAYDTFNTAQDTQEPKGWLARGDLTCYVWRTYPKTSIMFVHGNCLASSSMPMKPGKAVPVWTSYHLLEKAVSPELSLTPQPHQVCSGHPITDQLVTTWTRKKMAGTIYTNNLCECSKERFTIEQNRNNFLKIKTQRGQDCYLWWAWKSVRKNLIN